MAKRAREIYGGSSEKGNILLKAGERDGGVKISGRGKKNCGAEVISEAKESSRDVGLPGMEKIFSGRVVELGLSMVEFTVVPPMGGINLRGSVWMGLYFVGVMVKV
mgnify:CR=1 FL=1